MKIIKAILNCKWNNYICGNYWRKNGDRRTPALIFNVGEYAVLKSKAIIRYMKEFTLHDSVHMFNMLHIIEKLLSVDIVDINVNFPIGVFT